MPARGDAGKGDAGAGGGNHVPSCESKGSDREGVVIIDCKVDAGDAGA
jgi:hypothetical protein